MLNGRVFCVVIDDDAGASRTEGHHFAPARRPGGQRGVVPEYLAEEALKVTVDECWTNGCGRNSRSAAVE